MNEQEKRQKIKEIRENLDISESQKRIHIQNVLMGDYISNNKNNNLNKTCEHGSIKCHKLYFECCDVYDPCIICHRQKRTCKERISRCTQLTCSECETEQNYSIDSSKCIKCGITFANNFCYICCYWTNGDLYHCDKCKCLQFKKEEVFHCNECDTCIKIMPGKMHTTHIKFQKEKCVCCNDSLVNHKKIIKLSCKHYLHSDCFNELNRTQSYKCPMCRKSMWDMNCKWNSIRTNIRFTPLSDRMIPIYSHDVVNSPYGKFIVLEKKQIGPNVFWKGEFENWNMSYGKRVIGFINENQLKKITTKNIYCNDCNKKCLTPFHYYGLECKNCGSFNTQV